MDLIQKYRPNGIGVTDLSAQLWCEKQLEFSLEKGRIKTTEMQKGGDRHQELHEEVAVLIKVKPKTKEDKIALMLHNSLVGVRRLLREKMTRELPILGLINSLFVVGSIDELKMRDGKLHISDTKTRFNNKMPSIAQKKITEFQLMLYKSLLDAIISKQFTYLNLLKEYNLNSRSRISEEFQSQIIVSGNKIEPLVEKLAKNVFSLLQLLPQTSNNLLVIYEHQETKKLIGTDSFQFSQERFQRECNFVEEFWLGKRKAIPVGERNRWKCNYCEFKEGCL